MATRICLGLEFLDEIVDSKKKEIDIRSMKDILRFIMARKKFILVPILLVLAIIAVLLVLGSATPVAPFVYTFF